MIHNSIGIFLELATVQYNKQGFKKKQPKFFLVWNIAHTKYNACKHIAKGIYHIWLAELIVKSFIN